MQLFGFPDSEEFRPILAGDVEIAVGRVEGDAVEDVRSGLLQVGGEDAAAVDVFHHISALGIDADQDLQAVDIGPI